MKATPYELKVLQKMQPGAITLSGFLGEDTRALDEIVADDAAALALLGYDRGQIADRMRYFTEASWNSYDTDILVDGIYSVSTEVTRGKLPCPYGHAGLYRKAVTTLVNTKNNIRVCWTSLNIHLIGDHGFFEGRGSVFRLDPETLVQTIF
jgi:hypothetical protein